MQVVRHYFTWHNFALIYDKQAPYEVLAGALRETADDTDFTIKSAHYVSSDTKEADIRSMFMQVRKYTRGEYININPF